MQDITASDLPNADGFLRRAALRVLAWVQAGLAYLHYGYLDWIARNATPFTATAEFLDAWAALAPTPVIRMAPQPAIGTATFTGANGNPIPSGTEMTRGDGVKYRTTAFAEVISGSVTAPIIAVVPGSDGDTDSGTPLTLSNTLNGISSAGTAATPITGGTDLELDDPLRSRMLESYATPPAGGDAGDYVTWALQVPGVTRAWTLGQGQGAGTVVVYFMADVAEAAHGGFPQGTNGVATGEPRDTPGTGDQLAVANHILPLQPVTALVYGFAPSSQSQNFTISGLSGTTTAQKASVNAAIDALLVQKGNPLATVGINQSDVDAAIGAVGGLPTFAVTSPSSWPITPTLGSLLTRGTTTFT